MFYKSVFYNPILRNLCNTKIKMNNIYSLTLNPSIRTHCASCILRQTGVGYRKVRWNTKMPNVTNTTVAQLSSYVAGRNEWIQPIGYKTGINVYNSLTRRKDELILPKGNHLTWYICGPTVYDKAHIGHASNYVRSDIIRRILVNYFDINVMYLMGITDIDDKIINKSHELETEFLSITNHFEREFFQELLALNCMQPTLTSRVTDNVEHIISFIKQIEDRGHAYQGADGSVYFDITKYGNYNKFQPAANDPSSSPGVKRNVQDFALWKKVKMGEPCWASPWGEGRPGWHIECSAMASRMFGNSIDIHSGGSDLMFPHHENELAQSCSFHDVGQWANYWLHTGYLHLEFDTEKMSKSLKNVLPTSYLLDKYTANQFRMFCMLSHYRKTLEFAEEKMQEAIILDNQIGNFLRLCDAYMKGQRGGDISEATVMQMLAEKSERVTAFLKDDFRTPEVMKEIFGLIHYVNTEFAKPESGSRSPGTIAAVSVYVKRLCKKLGFHKKGWKMSKEPDNMKLKEVLDNTVRFRWDVRNFALKPPLEFPDTMSSKEKKAEKNRIFGPLLKSCDELRSQLRHCKINVQDHKTYSSWDFEDSGNMSEDPPWEDSDADSPPEKGKKNP